MGEWTENTRLVLKTVGADRCAYGGFNYPEVGGIVEAPDWDGGREACGYGLHGLLEGKGDGMLLNWSGNAVWLVLAADTEGLVEFGGKCKFRRAKVVCDGKQQDCIDYLVAHGVCRDGIVGVTVTVTGGDDSTLAGGDDIFGVALSATSTTSPVQSRRCRTLSSGTIVLRLQKNWGGFSCMRAMRP